MLLRVAAAVSLSLVCLSVTAHDHQPKHDETAGEQQTKGLSVKQAWSRAMPPSAPTGAVYFVLENNGDQQLHLTGVETPRAGKAELHTHVHEGEMMRMQQVESVVVPAKGRVQFKPGGHHVMLFDLQQPLVAGERFPLTLKFDEDTKITTEVSIEEQAPSSSDEPAHH